MSCFCKFVALALSIAVGAHASLTNKTVKQIAAPNFRLVGQGECRPKRPQWVSGSTAGQCKGATFHDCQHGCLSSDQCIGFDYDPKTECCHIHLMSDGAVERDVPQGFVSEHGDTGDDFHGTGGSQTAWCYERANHRSLVQKYGNGTCGSNRPQRHGHLTFPACRQACVDNSLCIGFDYDPMELYCRLRFQKMQDARTTVLGYEQGLALLPGDEGPGFAGTYPSNATCYVKTDVPFSNNYDLLVYGSGTCEPNRPRWEYYNVDFQDCQQTCLSNDKCIGFDYDAADSGCCRIHFSFNDETTLEGEEGPGFSGSSGSVSATCYVKPNHPSSTKYDLFIYGPGNCQPDRPQWRFGNPATFGVCQQKCLKMDDCMGFDYDPAFGGYCRLRFATNKQAHDLLTSDEIDAGWVGKSGEEGYGFMGSSGQHSHEAATCYVKPEFPGKTMQAGTQGEFKSILPALLAAVTALTMLTAFVVKIGKTHNKDSMTAPLLVNDTPEESHAQIAAAC